MNETPPPNPDLGIVYPPVWHDDGTVTLWHPDSPGTRIRIRPGFIRRTLRRREPFATLTETIRYFRARRRENGDLSA